MAQKSYQTIYESRQGRYEEKKSVFLGDCRNVTSEEEASAFVDEIRKKYYDARHHCFAYRIGTENPQLRSSDDGEPSGTAGRPILDVITGQDLTNVVVVVTRYFGGTLLGTGGLVRAYTAAARDCLEQSVLIRKEYGVLLRIHLDYGDLGKIQYTLAQEKIPIVHSDYSDAVDLEIIFPSEDENRIQKKITELTAGKAGIERVRYAWYTEVNGEIQIEE